MALYFSDALEGMVRTNLTPMSLTTMLGFSLIAAIIPTDFNR